MNARHRSLSSRLYTVAYFESFVPGTLFPYTKVAEGKYAADWPLVWSDGKLGLYSVADTGAFVLAAFKEPQAWIGNPIRYHVPEHN